MAYEYFYTAEELCEFSSNNCIAVTSITYDAELKRYVLFYIPI